MFSPLAVDECRGRHSPPPTEGCKLAANGRIHIPAAVESFSGSSLKRQRYANPCISSAIRSIKHPGFRDVLHARELASGDGTWVGSAANLTMLTAASTQFPDKHRPGNPASTK